MGNLKSNINPVSSFRFNPQVREKLKTIQKWESEALNRTVTQKDVLESIINNAYMEAVKNYKFGLERGVLNGGK